MFKKNWIFILFAISILFAGCNGDNNNDNPIVPDTNPTISGISPSTFSRGSDHVEMVVTGTNLTGANAAWLGDGTTVFEAQATDGTHVTVKFSVQRKAVLGKRDISVTTPKGTAFGRGIFTVSGDAPVAKFTVTPANNISQKSNVTFDASPSSDADGTVKTFAWDFGDGRKDTGKIVTHAFGSSGTYDVKLTVTDNDDQSNSGSRSLEVSDVIEIKCTQPSSNHGFLGATVIGVEGHYAIVQMGKDRTCANTFYLCGDMRLDEPEIFRGIIKEMYFLGDGKFKILNDCPYRWPPQIGEYDVLHYKTCAANHCP